MFSGTDPFMNQIPNMGPSSRKSFFPICAALLLGAGLSSSAASLWNGGGTDNNMTTGDNWGGTAPTAGAATQLDFAGSTRTSPYNDFAANSAFGILYLDSGASAFSLSGNALNLNSKIQNNSSSPLTLGRSGITATAGIQINPVSGPITNSTPLTLGTFALDIYGPNTLTLINGANITGSGLLTVHTGTLEINPGTGNTLTCATKVTVGSASSATMNFRSGTATFN